MKLEQIKEKLQTLEYSFLKTNDHLGDNIILLGLGGSYAYGTNISTSDLDLRGCVLNTANEILTNKNFEQFVHEDTDTTIYSFNKLINLLSNCNPNTIEILGLKPEHYLYVNEIGQQLLDNTKIFLSKKAVKTFGGYAIAQFHRLNNKTARDLDQEKKEMHILKVLNNIKNDFPNKYTTFKDDSILLYIDDALNCSDEKREKEIFMDIVLHHYPLRDYKSMWSEMNEVVKSYNKLGSRNSKAIEHGKIGKHMMHLIRLYFMCIDILEKEEVITYRENEHDLLMDVRNGKFLDKDDKPIEEFFEIVNDLEQKMNYAAKNTSLPEKPNYNLINEFLYDINRGVVLNEK